MTMLSPILVIISFIAAFAILNRARGTQLFNATSSTVIGRLVSTLGMSLLTAATASHEPILFATFLAWTWASLMLWCTPAWDAYWSAAIGHDPANSRLWGLTAMTLRMTLAVPSIVGLAYLSAQPFHSIYASGILLMGLPYYLAGYLNPKNPIGMAEPMVGAILGLLIFLTLSS